VSQSKGMGLLGIEERVARLGGKCEIHSEPGNGTILMIKLPFIETAKDRRTQESETDSHSFSG
jgi:signal transduction histidine kinase